MSGIGRKIAKGAAWMVLFKVAERSLGLVSTIILARLLMPKDFGIVAMAMSVIAVLELLSAFNFDLALIHDRSATRKDYDSAWTLNLIFSSLLALLMVALAVPTARFYREPRLEDVIYVLAFSRFITGFENVGIIFFRKDMEFNREFSFLLSRKLASFLVTIVLALLWRNYWALVVGQVTGRVANLVLSFTMHPYRPGWSLAAWRELFHFSKWLLFNNLFLFLKNRFADFAIGRIVGSTALGLFGVAFQIANLPTTELIAPINRAIFPGYAKIAGDLRALQQGFLDVLAMIMLFALPAGAGIAATAPLLVEVFLGDKWLASIPILQIIAFYGLVGVMQTNIGSVYLAMGKPRITTYVDAAYIGLMVPLVILATLRHGVLGAAWAYLATALIILPVNYAVMLRTIDLRLSRSLAVMWRPLLASGGMFAAVRPLLHGSWGNPGLRLALAVAIGAGVYVVLVLLCWRLAGMPPGGERTLLLFLGRRYPLLGRLPGVRRLLDEADTPPRLPADP